MYGCWRPLEHSFIFNDFRSFLFSELLTLLQKCLLSLPSSSVTGHATPLPSYSCQTATYLTIIVHYSKHLINSKNQSHNDAEKTVLLRMRDKIKEIIPPPCLSTLTDPRTARLYVSYHLFPLHTSVLVPRLHLELCESK